MDRLILRDVFNRVRNITDATNKGVGGWEGGGEGSGLTMLSDTDDQVVCTVGQTDGHSSPTIPRAMQPYNGTELDRKLPY